MMGQGFRQRRRSLPEAFYDYTRTSGMNASWITPLIFVAYMTSIWFVVLQSEQVLPKPLNATVPSSVFSEERSFKYLQDLVDIAEFNAEKPLPTGNYHVWGRLAFGESCDRTVKYLVEEIEKIRAESDVLTSVLDVTSTSGEFVWINSPLVGVFRNITNIAVRIPASDGSIDNAIMVSSHFDSTAFSLGASDNGVNVAMQLELLRVLIHNGPLARPVIILWCEAEESGLYSSQAYVQQEWYKTVTNVINLDSGGGWKQLVLGQVGPNNSWLLDAYRKHVRQPYAIAFAGDIYGTGLVPSNSDFRNWIGAKHDVIASFGDWEAEPCNYLAFKYALNPGQCKAGPIPPPNVTRPHVRFEKVGGVGNESDIIISVHAPEAATWVMFLNGTITNWTLSVPVPPKPAHYRGPIYADDQYVFVYRGRPDTVTFRARFQADPEAGPIEARLVTSYYQLTPLTKKYTERLPVWARQWGKSTTAGPVIIDMRFQLTA
eukprot:Colp12_sorted_trinity150504_noHs@23092